MLGFDAIPPDVLLSISSHLGKKDCRSFSRTSSLVNDTLAPALLRNVSIALDSWSTSSNVGPSANLSEKTAALINRYASSKLPRIAQHARQLTIVADGITLAQIESVEALKPIYEVLRSLTHITSLHLVWHGAEILSADAADRFMPRICEAVLHATTSALQTLHLTPPKYRLIIPEPLTLVRGLTELRIESNCSMCSRYTVKNAVSCSAGSRWFSRCAEILAENPSIQTLSISHPCNASGLCARDIFLHTLSDIDTLIIRGVSFQAMDPPQNLTLLSPEPFSRLRHLAIDSQPHRYNCDALWKSMHVAQSKLYTLTTYQVSEALITFIASFSGLRELRINGFQPGPSEGFERCGQRLISTALPRHSRSLELLSISYGEFHHHVLGWGYDPSTWQPVIAEMAALRVLAVHPAALMSASQYYHTEGLTEAYSTLLSGAGMAPSMEFLEILHYGPSARPGFQRVIGSALERFAADVQPDLGRPKYLKLGTKIYAAEADAWKGGWTYQPVSIWKDEGLERIATRYALTTTA